MMTVRQIERLWNSKEFARLSRDLLVGRPEASLRLEVELGRPMGVAALGIIRLDELNQTATPLYARLVQIILQEQRPDGGWGDVVTTAMCLRALLLGRGRGTAVEMGLNYLASLQKTDGGWPGIPIRRMPTDPYASAFVLMQLGQNPAFQPAIRFLDAWTWLSGHEADLDADAKKLWERARVRCGRDVATLAEAHLWS